MIRGKYQLKRYWFTHYLCDLITGYLTSHGYPARFSDHTVYHDKAFTKKFIPQLEGYMDCLREIGYILED